MFRRLSFLVLSLALTSTTIVWAADAEKPLRALLVTGGCCHNYALQSQELTNAIAKLARVEWTVVMEGGTGTRAELSLYDKPDWAKGFDVVIHNECFADTTNQTYIR